MAREMSPVFMIQAKQLFDAGKFSAAIMTLEEGLKQYPHFMSARVLLGEVHWTAGETALARASLEYVINLVPDNFAAHRKLALIYRQAGEVQLAMQSCRSVLQANPRDLEMRTLLDQLQELPGAASDPRKAEPPSRPVPLPTLHDPPPHSVLGSPHLVMASDPAPATLAPRESESIDSETLAELYILQGHHDKGLLVYHRLAARYPQNKQYRDRIEALERPAALDAARPSESAPAVLTLPQEATSPGQEVYGGGLPGVSGDMGQEVRLGGLPGGPGETGEEVRLGGLPAGAGDKGQEVDLDRLQDGSGETGQEVRLGGLPGGLGEMARRKNQVRRLESWLQVVRARRRV